MKVMERAVFHSDNCYNVPNMKVTGHLCKTNMASNTAFRGFGGPQGLLVIESVMSEIASRYGLSQLKVSSNYCVTEILSIPSMNPPPSLHVHKLPVDMNCHVYWCKVRATSCRGPLPFCSPPSSHPRYLRFLVDMDCHCSK